MMLSIYINMSNIFNKLSGTSCTSFELILCLNIASILLIISIVGILWNNSCFITTLICVELMFLSISLNFIFISIFSNSILGNIYVLLIITSAASETAIGVSFLIIAYRLTNKVTHNSLISLRG